MQKEILLNNGVMIPTPGFGTFLTPDGSRVDVGVAGSYGRLDSLNAGRAIRGKKCTETWCGNLNSIIQQYFLLHNQTKLIISIILNT